MRLEKLGEQISGIPDPRNMNQPIEGFDIVRIKFRVFASEITFVETSKTHSLPFP